MFRSTLNHFVVLIFVTRATMKHAATAGKQEKLKVNACDEFIYCSIKKRK
jgi:hypothetical protein